MQTSKWSCWRGATPQLEDGTARLRRLRDHPPVRLSLLGWLCFSAGCATAPSPNAMPAPAATDLISQAELATFDPSDIVAGIRRVKPQWFDEVPGAGGPRLVVDREPTPLDGTVIIGLETINQIAFFPPEAARTFFGTSDGRPIIAITTTAGDSRSATALRPPTPLRLAIEPRIGLVVGWERLDSVSTTTMVEAFVTAVSSGWLSLSGGVHQSTHSFTRSFSNGAVTDTKLRIRYAYIEPRYNLRLAPHSRFTPFGGFRLLGGRWRLPVAHPLDPAPDVLEGSDIGGGFIGGVAITPHRRLAVELSVSYSLFQMDVFAAGNVGYLLDPPIHVDGGHLLALRLGGMLRL